MQNSIACEELLQSKYLSSYYQAEKGGSQLPRSPPLPTPVSHPPQRGVHSPELYPLHSTDYHSNLYP